MHLSKGKYKIHTSSIERDGASSACDVSLSLTDAELQQNRPKTHEGFRPTAPRTPSKEKKGNRNFLSPRQVSVKLVPEIEVEHFTTEVNVSPAFNKRTKNRSLGNEIKVETDRNPIPANQSVHVNLAEVVENSLPSFILKGRNRETLSAVQMSTSMPFSMNNSLESRLAASVVDIRPRTAGDAKMVYSGRVTYGKSSNIYPVESNPAPLFNSALTTLNRNIRYSNNIDYLSNDLQFDVPYQTFQHHSSASKCVRRIQLSDNSSASTVFPAMDIENMLDYLLDSRNSSSTHASFIHVTPRHNLEKVKKLDFYDLVALERPGNPKSGVVWVKGSASIAEKEKLLKPHQIMQLSLFGLSVNHEDERGLGCVGDIAEDVPNEIIPLKEFLLEKTQFNYLRTGRFFGLFRELKIFKAWRWFARHQSTKRIKALLTTKTFFSDVELISCILKITRVTYELENEVELFAFHGCGAICVSDFVAMQINKNKMTSLAVNKVVNHLGEFVQEQYNLFVHGSKLAKQLQHVKDHHPAGRKRHFPKNELVDLDLLDDQANQPEVEWEKYRSMQRFTEEFRDKIKLILNLAQFRIESTIALCLEKFWLRMKQFIVGIKKVKFDNKMNFDYYWNIDPVLFDEDGHISSYTLAAYCQNIFPHSVEGKPTHIQNVADAVAAVVDNGIENMAKQIPFVMDESTLSGNPPTPATAHQLKTDNLAAQLTSMAAVKFQSSDEHHSANRHSLDGVKVTAEWEEVGSHLCLNVNLCIEKDIAEATDLLGVTNIDRVKVSILPSRTSMMNDMHLLCGSLGQLVNSLPDLRKHSLIYDAKLFDSRLYEAAPPDLDIAEANNPLSRSYFTCLAARPIYNSRGACNHAVETLRLIQFAYSEASELDTYLFKLFEIFRKLWSISPGILTKQLEKSLSLGKVKDYVEDPDMVDDLHRSNMRDKNRLSIFKNAASYLEEVGKLISSFFDIKHSHGLISSFKPVLEQLSTYRMIQYHLLFQKLPLSYSIRCSVLYDFLRKLEISFEITNPNLSKYIKLMKRLKNFESCKESFDVEIDVCDTIYYLINGFEESNLLKIMENMDKNSSMQLNKIVTSVLSQQPSSHDQPVISAIKLYRICIDQRERLATSMSMARSILLSQLSSIKADSISNKLEISSRIKSTSSKLSSFSMNHGGEYSLSEITQKFDLIGKEVKQLRLEVDSSVAGQLILVEAHDIIGAANAVLLAVDVERFPSMDTLETAYSHRSKAWKCIVDAGSIRYQIYVSRLVNNSISELAAQFNNIVTTHSYLMLNTTGEETILNQIRELIHDLKPKIDLLSYLSSVSMRHRHWKWLSEYVFSCCGLSLTFSGIKSEFVSVQDVSKGKDPSRLGNVYKLPFNEFVNRGIENHVDKVSSITAEAVIESMLENTLDTVEDALRSSFVQTSGEWLRDSRLREKIFLELNEMINLTHMSVLVKFCMKTVMIVDSTSQDMCLNTFFNRIEVIKGRVLKIEQFIENMQEIQKEWMYVMHFAKFSVRGEISRDAGRLYNTCTEDIKKIETSVAQNGLNLYDAFSNPNFEQELHSDALRMNLTSLMDDAQSSVQSILEACPRLSLLSYNKVVSLVKAWMLGPQMEIDLVSSCLHDLFEGVNEITLKINHGQRLYSCSGFVSSDRLEHVRFVDTISFTLPLDEFIREFDRQLRICIEKSCDVLILHRIACLKALLNDTEAHIVLENIGNVFSQRTCQLIAMINDAYLNQAFYLINFVSFAEDVWTALGFPGGCLAIARGDLLLENALFSRSWRSSVSALQLDCKENIIKLQDMMAKGYSVGKSSPKKCRALLSSLLLQEISFLKTTEELLNCRCVESVCELWAARYQLKFQYSKESRLRNSPIDVVLGSINISYGMEYLGAHIRSIPDSNIEATLIKVIGASFSSRGSVFISYDDQNSLFEVPGEYSVSCKDIASALGRLSTTLVSCNNSSAVRFFVSRLVYLDAVGCVDFTSIDHSGLQTLVSSLNSFWRCIDSKNDNYLQDSLKFPLKTKFTRNDLQTERRRNNIAELRSSISKRRASNTYCGYIVIGMASEDFYTKLSVFDHFYRSIFNAVSVSHNKPIEKLGVNLAAEGFYYGMELQTTLQNAFIDLSDRYSGFLKESFLMLVHRICTTLELKTFIGKVSRTLALFQLSKRSIPPGKVGRLKVEMQCFVSDLWEAILYLCCGNQPLITALRRDLFVEFTNKYAMVSSQEESLVFQNNIGGNCLQIQTVVNAALIKAALHLGLICNHTFIEKCALFWNVFSNSNNNVMVVSGESAVGKSAVINTVFTAIRKIGLYGDVIFGDPWPIICRRSAKIVFNALRNWYEYRCAIIDKGEIERDLFQDIEGNQVPSDTHVVGRTISVDDGTENNSDNGDIKEQDSFVPPRPKAVSFSSVPLAPIFKKRSEIPIETQPIKTSVVYHASMSASHLLGCYDSQGRWMDGILLRKLRIIDRDCQQQSVRTPASNRLLHVIILCGPVGYYVEQLFASPFFQNNSSSTPKLDGSSKHLLFPTGELHNISSDVKLILETNDVQNASPACFVFIPALRLSISSDICVYRLLNVWMRSVYHWLGDFPPWIDFIDELNKILLHTKFVEEILFCDSNASLDIPSVVIVSRIAAFLRYLEELLKETHDLALLDATFCESEEKDLIQPEIEESSVYLSATATLESVEFNALPSNESVKHSYIYKGVMTLGSKFREKLLLRARMSVVYSALWGFGGTINNTDKRRLFENAVRDATHRYFETVDLTDDHSLFDCVFNMNVPSINVAVQIDPENNAVVVNEGVPIKPEFNIFVDIHSDSYSRMVFRTPSTRSVEAAVRLLMMTGSNVLVLGGKNCGKTMMLRDILTDLKTHCATPHDMRNHVIENLVDVVNGARKPEGIFAAMEILKHVLREFSSIQIVPDSSVEFDKLWQVAGTALKSLWCGDSRANCKAKTVSSNTISLRGASSAHTLRSWFEREFATETKHVLETSRFSYGVAFIDDLHLCAYQATDMRMVQDQPDSLLKGVLAGTPLFTIRRNVSVRNPMTLGDHVGSNTASYHVNKGELPILHKELLSDIRLQSPEVTNSDDYIMQRMGIVAAATGDFNSLVKSSFFNQLLPHFVAISLPSISIQELHVCLTAGAYVGMKLVNSKGIIDVLKQEIVELSKFTFNMCKRMISSADSQSTTLLERSIRSLVIVDVSLVSRFCLSLQYGIQNISNPGGLLQLYSHEWKRYFLDPLPHGTQRNRIIALLNEQLDTIDVQQWSVTADWIKSLQEDFATHKDRVWTDASVLESISEVKSISPAHSVPQTPSSRTDLSDANSPNYFDVDRTLVQLANREYLPIELERIGTEKSLLSGSWSTTEGHYLPIRSADDISSNGITKVLDFTRSLGTGDLRSVLYPAAIALVLRMVRILSVANKHILLSGYFGTSRVTALHLAAKICDRTVESFDVKESNSVVEGIPSERACKASSFQRFLKRSILRAAGLMMVYSEPDEFGKVSLSFETTVSQRIMIIVSSAQQLSDDDRRLLLNVVDYEDPGWLFDDHEILGITHALRQMLLMEVNKATTDYENQRNVAIQRILKANAESIPEDVPLSLNILAEKRITTMDAVLVQPRQRPVAAAPIVDSTPLPFHQIFTGYCFLWVKKYLQDCIRQNLSLVIDTDIPRTIKLESSQAVGAPEVLALLKKRQPNVKKNLPNNFPVNAGFKVHSRMPRVTVKQRFSLSHAGNTDSREEAACNQDTNLFDPTQTQTASEINVSSSKPLSLKNGNSTVLGIFTCPILGPMLSRKFFSIWYDIDSMDAVKGICHTKMKNEEIFNKITYTSALPLVKPQNSLSPLVLCLRTSTIGAYVTSDENLKKGLTKAELVKFEKEEIRRKNFRGTSVLNCYNLLLNSSYHYDMAIILSVFSATSYLGIFKSFSTNVTLHDSQEKMVLFSIASFIEEARAVLPFMLSLPLPSDAMIVNEPILFPGPEAISEMAADQVCLMIRLGARVLVTRKLVLQTVSKGYEEAMIVLDNTTEIDEKLAENNEQLLKIVRKLTKEIDARSLELDLLDETFSQSEPFEQEQMLLVDIESIYVEIHRLENDMEDLINEARKRIFRFDQMEWQNFALNLSGKPVKSHLELMRALMVVINFTPPKVVKGEKGAGALSGGKMDDDAVAKYGLSLLSKSDEFASNLCTLSPTGLTPNHVNALRIMNLLMNSTIAEHIDGDKHSAKNIYKWVTMNLTSPEKSNEDTNEPITALSPNNIYDTLLYYLILVELFVGIYTETGTMRSRMAEMESDYHRIVEANTLTKATTSNNLKSIIDQLNQKVHQVNEGLLLNKAKMAVIERNMNQKAYIRKGLVESRAFVEEETRQIDNVLKTLVADVCVSVCVMLRAGWLPEQIRQESMEQLRIHIKLNNLNISETPFLLGNLVDRLQMRDWTGFSENSLSRDPASINAMSLVLLAPIHCLIVDSDGVACGVLNENILPGFEQFVITAQRFSVSVLETWMITAVETNKSQGISIIITDVQAGVSEDLVYFLSCDPTVDNDGYVVLKSNPFSEYQDDIADLKILCRIRVTMISTRMPSIDAFGVCRPLPSCCLKKVTIIQWPVAGSSQVYVDSKPLLVALEQSNVSDHTLGHKMSAQLCNVISPNHLSYCTAINLSVVMSTNALYHLEQEVIAAVYQWMNEKRSESVEDLIIDDLVEQAPVSLSFLSDDSVLQLILTVINTRRELNIDIEMNKSLLRELISYFSCISEVFSMTIDFIRICSSFIPKELLSPYALSVQSLCTNFAANAIDKANSRSFMKGIPPSLADMQHFSKKIVSFQRQFRKTKSSTSVPKNQQPRPISNTSKTSSNEAGRRVSVVHKVDNEKKRFGLMSNSRQQAMNEINFILMPLRSYFLREAVSYVHMCIRPGLEWITKFMLTITTWSQSSKLPIDELRAVMYLVQQSAGHVNTRYSFFMPFNGVEGTVGNAATRATAISLVDGVKKIRSSTLSSGAGLTKTSSLNSMNDAGISGVNSDGEEDFDDDEEEVVQDEFLEQLPGAKTMSTRATAFRINEAKKIPSDSNGRQSVRFSKLYKARHTVSGGKGVDSSLAMKKNLRWMDKGLGSMDGLWINSRSDRWKISGTESKADSAIQNYGCHLLLDSLQSNDVSVKNRMLRPTVRLGDPFEVDWQRLKGVRIFGTAGSIVGGILGAAGQDDIIALRRASSSRLSFMIKAPESSPAGIGNAKRNTLLSLINAGKKRKSTIRKTIVASKKDYVESVIDVPKDTLTSRHSRLSFKIKAPINITQISIAGSVDTTKASAMISKSGRHVKGVDAFAVRMTNMSTGIGEHRSSLLSMKSQKSTVDKLGGKFSNSLSSAGSSSEDYSSRNEPIVDDITDLITNDMAYQNIILLEQHSSLAAVFKGMSTGINRNIYDFADWKDNVSQLCSVDAHKLLDSELEILVNRVKPPVFEDINDDDKVDLPDDGLWIKGHELTILQSMLFSEAVVPGSGGCIAEVFFALVASYLKKSGHVVQNVDETSPEEDEEDDEVDFGEENEDESLSGTEKNSIVVEDGEDYFEGDKRNAQAEYFRNILVSDAAKKQFKAYLQEGVSFINCWTKLQRTITGRSTFRGPQKENSASKYSTTARDYNDWESVLLDVLCEDPTIDKFVFMKGLRDSLNGVRSCVFLSSHLASSQIAVFSQRARDYSMHNNRHMNILNCNVNEDIKNRSTLTEFVKSIKSAINSSGMKKAMIEFVNLKSSFGNSVMSSVLLHGGYAVGGFATKSASADKVTHLTIRAELLHRKDSLHDTHFKSNFTSTGNYKKAEPKPWYKTFPLIVSAEWGDNETIGCGPHITLAELNYIWLPRYFSPDVISKTTLTNYTSFDNTNKGLPPSVLESCGILCEELETSLLWVMNTSRSIARSRITDEIRQRLKFAGKFEIRATSCLITIWQLVLYLRSANREESGMAGIWSSCLNPLSLWQLSRLMIKTSDILKASWKTRVPLNPFNDHGQVPPVVIVSELVTQPRFIKAMCLLVESFSCAGCDFYSTSFAKKGQMPINVAQKIHTVGRLSMIGKEKPAENFINSLSNVKVATKPNDSQRARKQMKKLLKKQDELRTKYVQQLSSVEKFSFIIQGNENVKSKSVDQEFIERFLSFAGLYMAEVIAELTTSEMMHTKVFGDKTSSSFVNFIAVAMNARKQSSKMNIKSFLDLDTGANLPDDEVVNWPSINKNLDVSLGGLNSKDIIKCLVKWTFDGSNGGARKIKNAVDKKTLFEAVKKLSLKVKSGEIKL